MWQRPWCTPRCRCGNCPKANCPCCGRRLCRRWWCCLWRTSWTGIGRHHRQTIRCRSRPSRRSGDRRTRWYPFPWRPASPPRPCRTWCRSWTWWKGCQSAWRFSTPSRCPSTTSLRSWPRQSTLIWRKSPLWTTAPTPCRQGTTTTLSGCTRPRRLQQRTQHQKPQQISLPAPNSRRWPFYTFIHGHVGAARAVSIFEARARLVTRRRRTSAFASVRTNTRTGSMCPNGKKNRTKNKYRKYYVLERTINVEQVCGTGFWPWTP